jgi:hypothetical protein
MPGPWDTDHGWIRIVQRPDGEAPEWVRDAWIGLELPLKKAGPVRCRTVGVLTAPRTRFGLWCAVLLGRSRMISGYLTDAHASVGILQRHNPTASMWWKTKAADHVQPGCEFIFDLPACAFVPPRTRTIR